MSLSYIWAKLLKKVRGSAIKDSSFEKDCKVGAGSHIWDVEMGKHTYCGYDCEIYHCKIGSFCSIANSVRIGGVKHPYEWVSTSPVFYKGKNTGVKEKFAEYNRERDLQTNIGNDVWIGEGAYIKAGICVGDGAVVGMGSVVTKDVAPYAIVAGNPARVIKYRFDEEICKMLLETQWWRLEDNQIKELSKCVKNPLEFVEKCKKLVNTDEQV